MASSTEYATTCAFEVWDGCKKLLPTGIIGKIIYKLTINFCEVYRIYWFI